MAFCLVHNRYDCDWHEDARLRITDNVNAYLKMRNNRGLSSEGEAIIDFLVQELEDLKNSKV